MYIIVNRFRTADIDILSYRHLLSIHPRCTGHISVHYMYVVDHIPTHYFHLSKVKSLLRLLQRAPGSFDRHGWEHA